MPNCCIQSTTTFIVFLVLFVVTYKGIIDVMGKMSSLCSNHNLVKLWLSVFKLLTICMHVYNYGTV